MRMMGHAPPHWFRATRCTVYQHRVICFALPSRSADCCSWRPDGFATFYVLLASIALPWTLLLVLQLKLAFIADLIAQWYFQPAGELQTHAAEGVGIL
jgi:hypothetical protein